MKTSSISFLSYCLIVIIHCFSFQTLAAKHDPSEGFLQCLFHSQDYTSISNITYTQKNTSYSSILKFTIRNLRFDLPSTPKPVAIIAPLYEYQLQPVIYCSRKHGLQIRVRSGGHDYEGLSYTSQVPFILVDLINLESVDVDVASATAWVQSGASIGQLCYRIAEKSRTLGFPVGTFSTIGVGGHISGGGQGTLVRKYGLSADNVIDARLIDANGKILDRKSMGEDVFWAIRGAGSAGFGIVLAWKVKLVPVPKNVTVFTVQKTPQQNATQIIHRWQYVADKFPKDLFLRIIINRELASFNALFLGRADRLLSLMQKTFPELGVVAKDCFEMSWIDSVVYFSAFPIGESPQVLLNRTSRVVRYFKGKSDFVKKPMPIEAFEGIWRLLLEPEAATAGLAFTPYGGKMNEISESAIPFPHRAGNIYSVDHMMYWRENGTAEYEKHINWMRRLYKFIAPYVAKSPRTAYINYRDLDLGVNKKVGITSYARASKWGVKYFKNNFYKLAQVKTIFDPSNFFRNEQSVPLLSH